MAAIPSHRRPDSFVGGFVRVDAKSIKQVAFYCFYCFFVLLQVQIGSVVAGTGAQLALRSTPAFVAGQRRSKGCPTSIQHLVEDNGVGFGVQDGLSAVCRTHRTRSTEQQSRPLLLLHAVKEATFGMGCFWKPSEEMLKVPGVINTVVGYTGVVGRSASSSPPNYESVCWGSDPWVEAVRVYYDDQQISYMGLLDAFYQSQQPSRQSRQYSSIIFVKPNSNEQILAQQWLTKNAPQLVRTNKDQVTSSWTQIEPTSIFYKAESYHQQYWQKTRPRIAIMMVLLAISSGVLDESMIQLFKSLMSQPPSWYTSNGLHTVAKGLILVGSCYALLERRFNTQVLALD